jgi:hypothetical protein
MATKKGRPWVIISFAAFVVLIAGGLIRSCGRVVKGIGDVLRAFSGVKRKNNFLM